MTADRTLAEIVAEGKRQTVDYQTMILPHHDARRLLAVAEAALVLRNAMGADWPLSLRDEMAAFDAAAGGRS